MQITLLKNKLLLLPGKLDIIHLSEKQTQFSDYALDKKDLAILKVLSEDARASLFSIGNRIKLSSDAVMYRIRKMLNGGVIKRFTIVVNFDVLNYNWYTLCVDVKTFDKKDEARLKAFILDHPYIFKVIKVLGHWDLMFYITADDVIHFHNTVKEIERILGDKIVNFETWATYKEHSYPGNPRIIFEKL